MVIYYKWSKFYWSEFFLYHSWQNMPYSKFLNLSSTKWSNTLKQFVGKLPTNYLSAWPFVGLALQGLSYTVKLKYWFWTNHLAAPMPTLGDLRESSLTHQMLTTQSGPLSWLFILKITRSLVMILCHALNRQPSELLCQAVTN